MMSFHKPTCSSASLRSKALGKLTQLFLDTETSEPSVDGEESSLNIITHLLPIFYSTDSSKLYTIPINLNEWEVITSLTSASVRSVEQAEKLIDDVVQSYFIGSPRQRFTDVLLDRFKRENLRHPNELLTFQLTTFLLTLCVEFPEMEAKCCSLIDKYLVIVNQLYLKKSSALFSLVGFINAFVRQKSGSYSIGVSEFLWNKLVNMIEKNNFLQNIEEVLAQSQEFNNEIMVQYYNAEHEICGPYFFNLIAQFQMALASQIILGINTVSFEESDSLAGKMLELQILISSYKDDNAEFSEHDRNKIVQFQSRINDNKNLLIDILSFAFKNASKLENLDLSSESRANSTFTAKALFLETICLTPYLYESNDSEQLVEFTDIVTDYIENFLLSEVINSTLIESVICTASFLNFFSEKNSLSLIRVFPLLIASPSISNVTVENISRSFTYGLCPLNEDAVVNTIYSINNMLAMTDTGMPTSAMRERQLTKSSFTSLLKNRNMTSDTFEAIKQYNDSAIVSTMDSSPVSSAGYHEMLFKNCVTATITIASNYDDPSITALTTTILTQKVNVVSNELDTIIIDSLALLAPYISPSEFSLLQKFYRLIIGNAIKDGKSDLLHAIIVSKTAISKTLKEKSFGSELYRLQLFDLLDIIIASGEVEHKEHRTDDELSEVAKQIAAYLVPLAALLPTVKEEALDVSRDETLTNMFRNVWFNMVIHGFYIGSDLAKSYAYYLSVLAHNTPPLTSDFPANKKEMSLEMNSILRRGSSSANAKQQKQAASEYLTSKGVQARGVSTTKLMFVASTVFLETIRCDVGDCSKVLLYFSDPSISSISLDKNIDNINYSMIRKYTKAAQTGDINFYSSQAIAKQLKQMLLFLAHKNSLLQNTAFKSCEVFIKSLPSALCHHESLFLLLDLMTALFDSVVDCETNRFEPKFDFHLKHSGNKVTFPISISWRRDTLSRIMRCAREWIKFVMEKSSQDIKILLQSYLSDLSQFNRSTNVECGVSFAVEMAGSIMTVDKELSKLSIVGGDRPNTVAGFISQHTWRSKYLVDKAIASSPGDLAKEIESYANGIREKIATNVSIQFKDLTKLLNLSAAMIIHESTQVTSLIYNVVHIPFAIFTASAMKASINVWLSIMKEKPNLSFILLAEIGYCWMRSVDKKMGLYSSAHDIISEESQVMEYAPYNKKAINKKAKFAAESLEPHGQLIVFLKSYFESSLYQSEALLKCFTVWVGHAVEQLNYSSLHPYARMIRNELLSFAILVMNVNYKQGTKAVQKLCIDIVKGGLYWYKKPVSWPFGANELRNKADLEVATELHAQLRSVSGVMEHFCKAEYKLLKVGLLHELYTMKTWLSPTTKFEDDKATISSGMITIAVKIDPKIMFHISNSTMNKNGQSELTAAVVKNPMLFVGVPEALDLYLSSSGSASSDDLHYVTYWSPTTPLKSINLFLPNWNKNRFVLQYAVSSLESQDVNVTFFYVPQIVQCLRYDNTGYVERLIIDTARISVLFSHQIIWNMLANCYKGDEGLIEDEIKPILDKVREKLVSTFSKSHREFYEREFSFFNEVTGISGKLKPYIKKSKAEKKQKIDEEMGRIVIEPNVYLPSNPDGVVVDIDRKSGKPLQSHAKAPFMATFKIKKETESDDGDKIFIEKWQAAIFKVGDDCRQDVLALQLISMFRTIWSNIGLDVFVFPYRVTATAPGCGVIDVLPNSISRDMLGREAVNGLYEYFISKFGNEGTIEFQNARNNFVKSLAGYSVISYLLQFKDRHNGNIMYDDQGHCLHIDFGFIFDIVPGGVKFEAVPFKLTKEMVNVMGGSQETQAYRDFEELCIKAYLAARPHMKAILECVEPMLGSGLPCFKGAKTMKNLEARFQPQRQDHEAALFMKSLIKKSYESLFTKGYDEFQRWTNGIPY